MAAQQPPYITTEDKVVGEGHPTLPDVANRVLKWVLDKSGMDVDVDGFTGFTPVYNVRAFGAVGDGVTDDSAAIQSAIDAGKGKRVVIPHGTFLCAGLTLPDSTYDGTEIVCEGGELKLKPHSGVANFDTSIYAGLIVTGAARVVLDLKWDGNRSNQAAWPNEGLHCVVLAGADSTHVRSLTVREIPGDGLYIDWRSPLGPTSAPNSRNIRVGTLKASNTADAGRNALSVISCDGLTVGSVDSYKVGGIINGFQMPGGVDLEPNWPTQSVTDVVIGEVNVVSAGSTGLAVQGIATTNDATRDWNAQRITIGIARLKLSSQGKFLVRRAREVTAKVEAQTTGTRGFGFYLDYGDKLKLDIGSRFTTYGGIIGYDNFVYDSEIQLDIRDYSDVGLAAYGVGRSTLRGRIFGASVGTATSAIYTFQNGRGALTQTGVVYEVDAPYDGVCNRGFYNDPTFGVTFGTGTHVRNCNLLGYSSSSTAINATLPQYNVQAGGAVSTGSRFQGSGTPHVSGDYASITGWGAGASISVSARDSGGRVSITCGTAPSADPAFVLTYKDGPWSAAPAVVVSRGDNELPQSGSWRAPIATSTGVQFQFVGTPVAGTTYVLDFITMGK